MKITEETINHNIVRLINEQDISEWIFDDDSEIVKSNAVKTLMLIEGMVMLGNALKEVLKE